MEEQSRRLADDPFSGRRPTSHERRSGQPWDASYRDGPAPWDIGRPQPAVVRLASEGGFVGEVLDAGCGTGENALHIASLGLTVLGIDVAETALAVAREKADRRGIKVNFAAADAFQLERLGRRFETVLDCGLFHSFNAGERPGYVASLASVSKPGATLYVLCFSGDGPDIGPHPVDREELRAAFDAGQWVGCCHHRTRPDSHQVPRQRGAGLARDHETNLGRGDWPGERLSRGESSPIHSEERPLGRSSSRVVPAASTPSG